MLTIGEMAFEYTSTHFWQTFFPLSSASVEPIFLPNFYARLYHITHARAGLLLYVRRRSFATAKSFVHGEFWSTRVHKSVHKKNGVVVRFIGLRRVFEYTVHGFSNYLGYVHKKFLVILIVIY